MAKATDVSALNAFALGVWCLVHLKSGFGNLCIIQLGKRECVWSNFFFFASVNY
ncbi:hypothetical protein BCR41DRAFT_344143 [Lobosporangium transversale]|uniref:Uncharacterized protein n=1 Tax=Lobosporangium transversale TaxID=64571 RepID=A0A1Y2H2Q8_9FUNG|nr:hypothetical protein BCR41DRAFT_344143 [Lobosporangium transversale]ORZ28826.1 hypothetical protein BCR41DRAFT_344143 [Lobosporangium transversale]|eukprot:XP_021886499.1 hypothetical protein BCR41DRAFT_344143 [Lobosporangium transversale]